jgi:hypothetical protein
VLLHFASQDLKRPVIIVVRTEVPAKGEILFHLRGSEPKNLSQIGNHAIRISLCCREGNWKAFCQELPREVLVVMAKRVVG